MDLLFIIAVFLILVQTVNVFAVTENRENAYDENTTSTNMTSTLMRLFPPSEYEIKSLPNGKVQIVVKNPVEFLKSQNIVVPANTENLSVVIDISDPAELAMNSEIQPTAFGYYTAKPYLWTWCAYTNDGMIPGSYSSGKGPITLTSSVSHQYQHSYTATVGITAGEVSAGVGFTIGETFTVTSGSQYYVPAGYYGHLYAYPYVCLVEFDVYNIFGTHVGKGIARKYLGAVWVSNSWIPY